MVSTLDELVVEADIVLSILVPAHAERVAQAVARVISTQSVDTPFVDCNAIAPQTTQRIEKQIVNAGASFIDGSIIGPPPGRGQPPRLYVSGQGAHALSALDGDEITVKVMGDRVGDASSIKMCYAALTKGTATLRVALLTAARALGVDAALTAELAASQENVLRQMRASIPALPANAHRWIGEMEEIAATFDSVGLSPGFHQGAAAVYRLLGQTEFAHENPETIDTERTLETTIEAMVALLSIFPDDRYSQVSGTTEEL
tara:strand:- start:2458 stop:3237 length:780 start_codon:yes stop_codon:yes gene_type:complete